VLCKDRVFETIRSLYTPRPTQSSVLRRNLGFNAEVAEYARISRIASRDHNMLAQVGIVERIPGLSAQFEIKSPSTDPNCMYYNYRVRSFYTFRSPVYALFYSFFKT